MRFGELRSDLVEKFFCFCLQVGGSIVPWTCVIPLRRTEQSSPPLSDLVGHHHVCAWNIPNQLSTTARIFPDLLTHHTVHRYCKSEDIVLPSCLTVLCDIFCFLFHWEKCRQGRIGRSTSSSKSFFFSSVSHHLLFSYTISPGSHRKSSTHYIYFTCRVDQKSHQSEHLHLSSYLCCEVATW
jgi:hypothetical protein